jgi:pyruvate formate lyase activating enzyme
MNFARTGGLVMKIVGLQKLTLLDYPGHLGAIVFLGGCNFRCPFCQNSSLVLSPGELPEITIDEFRSFLRKRSGILEGICVTGGEPTLHPDLPKLFHLIKSEGYLAKLDTNGTNPELIRALVEDGLVDYVAMDIKAGRENYARVCGFKSDTGHSPKIAATQDTAAETHGHVLEKVRQSVELLKCVSIEYEFRTTVVKGLHTAADFEDIAAWIAGCPKYFLQSFRDCDEVLLKGHSFTSFSEEELQQFLHIVQKKIPQACLRGV